MTHRQHIRMHRVQRHRRIDQGLALFNRTRGNRHVDDIKAKPFSRQFERGSCTGRVFKKEIDQRAAVKDVVGFIGLTVLFNIPVGALKNGLNIERREPFDAEQMLKFFRRHTTPSLNFRDYTDHAPNGNRSQRVQC